MSYETTLVQSTNQVFVFVTCVLFWLLTMETPIDQWMDVSVVQIDLCIQDTVPHWKAQEKIY